jgi:RNA polymerase sigma factor (sigma-70 family)
MNLSLRTNALSPLEIFRVGEDRAEVAEALLKLERNYHDVLVLRFRDEMSLEEIARAMNTSLSTTKSRFYRGLGVLKLEIHKVQLSASRTKPVSRTPN